MSSKAPFVRQLHPMARHTSCKAQGLPWLSRFSDVWSFVILSPFHGVVSDNKNCWCYKLITSSSLGNQHKFHIRPDTCSATARSLRSYCDRERSKHTASCGPSLETRCHFKSPTDGEAYISVPKEHIYGKDAITSWETLSHSSSQDGTTEVKKWRFLLRI